MNEKMFTISVEDEFQKNNRFVLGQLAGIAKVMYGMTIIKHFSVIFATDCQTMVVRTTEENWKAFTKTVKKHYRGMCKFSTKVDKKFVEMFD